MIVNCDMNTRDVGKLEKSVTKIRAEGESFLVYRKLFAIRKAMRIGEQD